MRNITRHGRAGGSGRRLATLVASVVTLGGLVAACSSAPSSASPGSSSSSSSSSSAAPIKVGYLVPLTGTAAGPGLQEKEGWQLGLKVFGSKVDGHPIVTYFEDTQGQPSVSLSDAKLLVQSDHVQILEGPLLANDIAAVNSYVDPLGLPLDDLSECSSIQLTDYAKYGNGFSSAWNCAQPDIVAAKYLYGLGIRHVTLVGADYAFGWLSEGLFAKEFTTLGGTIDRALWPPITTTDFSSYISQIPRSTQAVFSVLVGAGASDFVNAYATFGLKGKIPLYGNTTLTDYSVLPAETPSAVLGTKIISQYCDGIPTKLNTTFANLFYKTYHTYPGYYGDAGFTKARLVISALQKLHGVATDSKAVIQAMKSTPIVSARGPVSMNTQLEAPTQNIYVCQVEKVNGVLRNVPIKTYPNVTPNAGMSLATFKQAFAADSVGQPSA